MSRFEVHSHTDRSNIRLIDCINKVENLIDRAIEIGLSGIAITDHESLAAHVQAEKYYNKIKDKNPNFKLALGNEIYLVDNRENTPRFYHFILIAKDAVGYKQLRKLSSLAWMNSFHKNGMERVPTLKSDLERIIAEDPGHLIATSACLGGELSSSIVLMQEARRIGDAETAQNMHDNIVNFMQWCIKVFGDDFYVELAPGASEDQITANRMLYKIAELFNRKVVIGSDAHFLRKEDRYVHKAYLNSKNGEREVDSFYEFAYLQDKNDIIKNLTPSFENNTENLYNEFCNNSMDIFNKITSFSLAHKQQIPKIQIKEYPKKKLNSPYPTLNYLAESVDNTDRCWVNECLTALKEKDLWKKEYLERLEEEAKVKKIIGEKLETNMFAYPITLQHYVNLFWECGSTVGAGRGSSCSGLNHYLLGITQLDPLEWDLPWWRYLNPEREEIGDIDLDLCPSKRPLILNKIKEERGQHFNSDIDELSKKNLGCTLIATFGTESTKSAILTSCRGYRSEEYPDGIDVDTAQYLSSLVPSERGFVWSLSDVINGDLDKDRKPVKPFLKEVQKYEGLLDIMKGIEGLISRRGSHASGVIFFDEDPYEFGSFMRAPNGDITTQVDLHDAEYMGLTKYDLKI